jgi:hypothetical protein
LPGVKLSRSFQASAAQHEKGFHGVARCDRVSQAHMTSNGTFCSAVPPVCCHLSERSAIAAAGRDDIDCVGAAGAAGVDRRS